MKNGKIFYAVAAGFLCFIRLYVLQYYQTYADYKGNPGAAKNILSKN